MADLREIVLDTETTGLRHFEGDRLIEIGCIELINRRKTDNHFHVYINPEREISSEAFGIHGISNEFVKDKPKFKEIAKDFLNFIGDSTLVIHNAGFDIGFINMELKLLKLPVLFMERVIDTLLIARKKFPKAPANLDALCKKFNISLSSRTKHGALIDAELLAMVYIALLEGDQAKMSFGEMKAQNVEFKNVSKNFPQRNYKLSATEENRHKEFIGKIPNCIWDAIKVSKP